MRRGGWLTVFLAGLVGVLAAAGTASCGAPAGPRSSGRLTAAVDVKPFSRWLDEQQVKATSSVQWAEIARHNKIIVLNSWDFPLIPVLKQANPKIQVWVYKNLSGVRSDDCTARHGDCGTCGQGVIDDGLLSSGMGYCWVKRNHQDWLLRTADTGQPLQFRNYPGTWETDYGSLAYERQWIRNVIADVKDHGWDGVEVDNALTKADAYGVAAKYPSNAAVQAATYSALREVGPALRDADVASVFNVGYATLFPGLWQRWLGPVGGLEQEFYLSYSTQPNAVGLTAWGRYQNEISSCAAQHKSCWFHAGSYSAAVTSQTSQYALASYLLATDGRQFLAVGNMRFGSYAPQWTLAAPLGSMKKIGTDWGRYFVGGIAIANPSSSSSTVYLGGTYLDDRGQPISTVTLGPASGTVLRTATGHGQ